MSAIISVENLSKCYRISHQGNGRREPYTALRDVLANGAKSVARRLWFLTAHNPQSAFRTPPSEDFWALKDVSFEVQQGEVLGIIGRNGAGKSTLLKILSRITEPTQGRVTLRGRVASLLEVGTGFHPELTGRENIFLNGAILGMTRGEIRKKFDAIVAFAEVEKFLDTPVKRYSSGMYVRLAFAVAAHLDPEILVVDEVLAVGDAQFQKKCLGKMGEVAKGGRTVLFVSHQMGPVRVLTSKCMLLEQGSIKTIGPTENVVNIYLNQVDRSELRGRPDINSYHRNSISDALVFFTRIWTNQDPDETASVEMGQDFTLHFAIQTKIAIGGALLAFSLKKSDGTVVASFFSYDYGFNVTAQPGTHVISCLIKGMPLVPGDYLVQVGIDQSADAIAWDVIIDYPVMFVVEGENKLIPWSNRPWGTVHWRNVVWSL